MIFRAVLRTVRRLKYRCLLIGCLVLSSVLILIPVITFGIYFRVPGCSDDDSLAYLTQLVSCMMKATINISKLVKLYDALSNGLNFRLLASEVTQSE